jgi:hypothetical protein
MEVPESADTPVIRPDAKIDHTQNALELWSQESGAYPSSAPLPIVRLDGSLKPLVLFTASVSRVNLHFVEDLSIREYVHCNGPDCVLCRVGKKKEVRDLLPVFDHLAGQIALLPISPSQRPGALRPLLTDALPRVIAGERLVLILMREDNLVYHGTVVKASAPVEARAASAIAEFERRFKAKEIYLAAAYPRRGNEALGSLDTIKRHLEVGGIA